MQEAIIDINDYNAEMEEMRVYRHIEMIVKMNLMIPSHVGTTFWLNMLNDSFVKEFTYEIVERLIEITEEDEVEKIILSIFFSHIAFQNAFNMREVQDFIGELLSSNDPNIRNSLLLLQTYKYTGDGLLCGLIAKFPGQTLTPFHETYLPVITLSAWFLNMRKGKENVESYLDAVKNKMTTKHTKNDVFIMLHLLRVCLTLFPTISNSIRMELLEMCKACLGMYNPVSSIAGELFSAMKFEASYPLSMYFGLLERMSSMNGLVDGVCPLIFDGDIIPLLPVFLYTPTDDQDASLDRCYVKFGRLFLAEFGRKDPPLSDVSDFLEMFSTEEQDLTAVRTKFVLASEPDLLENPQLLVPVIQFSMMKVKGETAPCNGKFPNEKVAKRGSGKELVFENEANSLFADQVWKTAVDRLDEIPNNEEEVIRVVVVGNEATLGSFLVSHFSKAASDPAFGRMKFIVHFVPSSACTISEFLSSFDNVYDKFVAPLCHVAVNTAPSLVSSSGSPLMPAIDDVRTEPFEPNLFFSYPSPMHMFKCGVHHYMHFANETVSVPVWECILSYSNGKKVVVPFIVDVVFDAVRTSGKVKYEDLDKNERPFEVKKGRKIAFAGVFRQYRATSDNDSLQMSSDDDMIPVLAVKIQFQKSTPVVIDGRAYGMPKKASISPQSGARRLEFATFVPYHYF